MAVDGSMFTQMRITLDVSRKLDSARIPYMLTGSMALSFYTQPRMTRDLDFVVDFEPGDEIGIARLFGGEYQVDEEPARKAIMARSMFNIIHKETLFKVDFIVRKKTQFEHFEFARRKRMELDKVPTWVISKEDLIISKLNWAKDSLSDYQLRDVKNLLATGCDMDYVKKWVTSLNLEAPFNKARK
ncbi:MAG TPA: hypothetical protein VKX17_01485 [Planctomycetota bacterium]|nr:hypothetical protein [Planctomycetota bacterium]